MRVVHQCGKRAPKLAAVADDFCGIASGRMCSRNTSARVLGSVSVRHQEEVDTMRNSSVVVWIWFPGFAAAIEESMIH